MQGDETHARGRRTFTLRQLMFVMTVCAVLAALTANMRSFAVPVLCLAGFVAALGFVCYEAALRLESKGGAAMFWLSGCVMLLGSLLIAISAGTFILGSLEAATWLTRW